MLFRSTAPAIALAAVEAIANGDDPVLLVMPADHKINNPEAFTAAVEVALPMAVSEHLVTFGITPTHPGNRLWLYSQRHGDF